MEDSEKEKRLQEFRRIRDSIVDKLSSEEINEEIREMRLKLANKICAKSELTEEDAERISRKINHGIAKRLGLMKE